MVPRALFLFIVLLVQNSVISARVREKKSVEPRYNFNHPPSAEEYNPIPVAVVYEPEAEHSVEPKGRNINLADNIDENKSENEDPVESEAKNETVVEEKIETNDTSTSIVKDQIVKNQTKPVAAQPRAFDEYQIPVAVIYDSEPNTQASQQRSKSGSDKDGSKRRSSYARKQKYEAKVNQSFNEPSSKVHNEDSSSSNTKTFMKRLRGRDPVVPIIDMESYVFSHNGKFHYSYEGGDGTKAYSEGRQVTVDDGAGEAVRGGFSYTDKDGNDFSLTYTADENGYRPVGAHLPTPPPIPPAIARALAYLATATPEPVTTRPNKSSSQ